MATFLRGASSAPVFVSAKGRRFTGKVVKRGFIWRVVVRR